MASVFAPILLPMSRGHSLPCTPTKVGKAGSVGGVGEVGERQQVPLPSISEQKRSFKRGHRFPAHNSCRCREASSSASNSMQPGG